MVRQAALPEGSGLCCSGSLARAAPVEAAVHDVASSAVAAGVLLSASEISAMGGGVLCGPFSTVVHSLCSAAGLDSCCRAELG